MSACGSSDGTVTRTTLPRSANSLGGRPFGLYRAASRTITVPSTDPTRTASVPLASSDPVTTPSAVRRPLIGPAGGCGSRFAFASGASSLCRRAYSSRFLRTAARAAASSAGSIVVVTV